MSSLQTSNIKSLDGTLSVPTETVIAGSAKAWVNFNGTGTLAIRDSFNVASVTDNGTGNYAANLTTPLTNTNGVSLANVTTMGSSLIGWQASTQIVSVSEVRVYTAATGTTSTTLADRDLIQLAVFDN